MKKSIAAAVMTALLYVIPGLMNSGPDFNPKGAALYAADSGAVTSAPAEDTDNKGILIRVMFVILIAWAGLSVYLFLIDRRIARLEKELHE
jgi:CcmD family protein